MLNEIIIYQIAIKILKDTYQERLTELCIIEETEAGFKLCTRVHKIFDKKMGLEFESLSSAFTEYQTLLYAS